MTRIVTPGTVTDPAMLDSHRNTYIAAVVCDRARAGIAYADLSTGEFAATQLVAGSPDEVHAAAGRELLRLGAVEVVLPADHETRGWCADRAMAASESGSQPHRFLALEGRARKRNAAAAFRGAVA